MERAPLELPVGRITHHAAAQMTNGDLNMCVCEAAARVIINNPVELKDRGEQCVHVCACMHVKALYGCMSSCRQVSVVPSKCCQSLDFLSVFVVNYIEIQEAHS